MIKQQEEISGENEKDRHINCEDSCASPMVFLPSFSYFIIPCVRTRRWKISYNAGSTAGHCLGDLVGHKQDMHPTVVHLGGWIPLYQSCISNKPNTDVTMQGENWFKACFQCGQVQSELGMCNGE